MKSNTKFEADRLTADARAAARAATVAAFRAERAKLLAGTYDVSADGYSGEFWMLDARKGLPVDLALEADRLNDRRELHRLPNGDWLEILGGKSWTRHTYDLAYALDRARRSAIGGYSIRADLAEVLEQIVAAGANHTAHYAEWQQFRAAKPYVHAYGGTSNLYADEQRLSWIRCITEDMLPRHPSHAALLQRALELFGEPDVLRAFPAPIDVALISVTRDIEERIAELGQ